MWLCGLSRLRQFQQAPRVCVQCPAHLCIGTVGTPPRNGWRPPGALPYPILRKMSRSRYATLCVVPEGSVCTALSIARDEAFVTRYLNDREFRDVLDEWLAKRIYADVRADSDE